MNAGTITIKYKMDENDALISRRQAVSRISDLICLELKGRCPTWNDVYVALNELPTFELPERKQGHWRKRLYNSDLYCSECLMSTDSEEFHNFCPYCGADMREGEQE